MTAGALILAGETPLVSAAYGTGLRVSEVAALKVSDINSERMLLRIEQGKGCKDRHAMLFLCCLNFCAIGGALRGQGLAVPRPRSAPTHVDAPAQPSLPCGSE